MSVDEGVGWHKSLNLIVIAHFYLHSTTEMRAISNFSVLILALVAFCTGEENILSGKAAYFRDPPPAWSSSNIFIKGLRDYRVGTGENSFAVFDKMEKADNEADISEDTEYPENVSGSIRIRDIYDPAFIFPSRSRASTPYAVDRYYSRDTLYRESFGNGLFTEEFPCSITRVITGQLQYPAMMLRPGMTVMEVINALGIPDMKHRSTICYRWCSAKKRPAATENSSELRYESIRCYFENDSLYAIKVRQSRKC